MQLLKVGCDTDMFFSWIGESPKAGAGTFHRWSFSGYDCGG